jgi:Cft2 family RNA processing exonuclease
MQHMGAVPIVFGRLGLGGVPCICTTPVSKFGKMLLYDFSLNKEMEGVDLEAEAAAKLLASKQDGAEFANLGPKRFELDDVDLALSNVCAVKYNQIVSLAAVTGSDRSREGDIILCAYPSGRTIGGSIWKVVSYVESHIFTIDSVAIC